MNGDGVALGAAAPPTDDSDPGGIGEANIFKWLLCWCWCWCWCWWWRWCWWCVDTEIEFSDAKLGLGVAVRVGGGGKPDDDRWDTLTDLLPPLTNEFELKK